MLKDARLSPDGVYRYWLTRRDSSVDAPLLTWVMLNPSTADHEQDDPTIRRCLGFARQWGFSGIRVVNLFAYRATQPQGLLYTEGTAGPVGPDNDATLRWAAACADQDVAPIVCAWGAHGELWDRYKAVLLLLRESRATLLCLGRTISGQPWHPLRVPYDVKVEPYGL